MGKTGSRTTRVMWGSAKEKTTPVVFEVRAGEVIVRRSSRGRAIIRRLSNGSVHALPFLRWAGGKQWIARLSQHLLPPNFTGKYFEPFLGAANLFLALKPTRAVLSDINQDLICTYRAIANDVEGVIATLQQYAFNKRFFLAMRKKRPRHPIRVAARFIYLNKTAWNGLYRVNPLGQFNVPYGGHRNLRICPNDRLRGASSLFHGATLLEGDFERSVSDAASGDFVYLDPPYITGHTNNGFLSYNARLFSWDDQVRLSVVAKRLAGKGVRVLVSNANHPAVSQLYDGFFHYVVERNSLIGGWEGTRGRVSESLISSFPLIGVQSEVL
ncbi:MAG: Dam family site-specific DNA-(adenine-N6)-methyltransferase [Phycisphaerales bacterium]|nr:Dam family site-specific DNA-(adenine-N6)-methyltransferase [Phycisphaerales bacterium]